MHVCTSGRESDAAMLDVLVPPMRTGSIPFIMLVSACRPAAPATIERSAAIDDPSTVEDVPPVERAKPLAATGDPQRAHTMRITADPSASVFGLVWHETGWAIGIAYTSDRNAVELYPIGRDGVGAVRSTMEVDAGFPTGLVAGARASDSPWVIAEARDRDFAPSGRFVAHAFDGRTIDVLAIPARDPGIRESTVRAAWRSGARPSGAAAWTASIVRKRSDAELEKLQRRLETRDKAARPAGGSTSPYVTLSQAARYYGGGAKSFEALRVANDGKRDLGGFNVAVGEHGFVGAHWIGKRSGPDAITWSIALHWFDDGTKLRAKRSIAAPERTFDGELALADDGTTYLVLDRSSPFDPDRALVVLTFDAAGTPKGERTIAVPGWVANSMATLVCNGHVWLAIDPYAAGTEAVDVIELVPDGPLSATRLWSGSDPEPTGNDGRPGRVVFAACGPERAAIAFQLRIATSATEVASGLLLAHWPS
jgi:hypothetical protein